MEKGVRPVPPFIHTYARLNKIKFTLLRSPRGHHLQTFMLTERIDRSFRETLNGFHVLFHFSVLANLTKYLSVLDRSLCPKACDHFAKTVSFLSVPPKKTCDNPYSRA